MFKYLHDIIYAQGENMTMIDAIEVKCPVCENDLEIYVILSTNTMARPDLDLRPAEMQRSTMDNWAHECPECGYVTSDFKKTPEITEDFLKSDSYKSCDGFEFKNPLSERFYRQHLIATESEGKFHALLYCAWACDDKDDEENAIRIRRKCLDYIDSLEANDDVAIQKADLLRRSKQFDKVIEEYSAKSFTEDIYNRICSFEVEKAIQKDSACYTVDDVINS